MGKWDHGDETSLWGERAFSLWSESAFHFESTRIFTFCLKMHFQFAFDFSPIIWGNWNNIQGWFQFLSLKITPFLPTIRHEEGTPRFTCLLDIYQKQ